MRFTITTVFATALVLVTLLTGLASALLCQRYMAAQQAQFTDALLEERAQRLQEDASGIFEPFLKGMGKEGRADRILAMFSQLPVSPYIGGGWDGKGAYLGNGKLPEWAHGLSAETFSNFQNRFVETGQRQFRYDNFTDFRRGEAPLAVSSQVVYFPEHDLFLGVGEPFHALSARLNAIRGNAVSAWRNAAMVLAGTWLLLCVLVVLLSAFYFKHALQRPLTALLGGEFQGTGRQSGFLKEVSALGSRVRGLESAYADAAIALEHERNRAIKAEEALARIESDFDHLAGNVREAVERGCRDAFAQEKRELYERIARVLPESDLLHVVKKTEFAALLSLENLYAPTWLGSVSQEYAELRGGALPKVGVQEPVFFKADAVRLRGVLFALLDNAYASGSDPQAVSMSCAMSEDGGVEISVGDHGMGISGIDAQLVHFPFYSTHEFGAGLGLPWARTVLAQMGFALRLYTEPGRGCAAVVHIPGAAVAVGDEGRVD